MLYNLIFDIFFPNDFYDFFTSSTFFVKKGNVYIFYIR